ncbi:hypothetical protein K438DRAFT_1993282 [Mycena galopus ATCC 62051]|nr:hypothetical protein K438DRAFT_1993282 [Mycena galopus ATCC 62051]
MPFLPLLFNVLVFLVDLADWQLRFDQKSSSNSDLLVLAKTFPDFDSSVFQSNVVIQWGVRFLAHPMLLTRYCFS